MCWVILAKSVISSREPSESSINAFSSKLLNLYILKIYS
ncbi:hypothetical protein ECMP0215612_5201 [Escherichia coli MP021561.2]|nr:hypothetical protein ECMP0215612_5201 [Escherichia coli MP021561.2]